MLTMRRPFTGRHLLLSLIGFFAIVISVNVLMAVLAVRSFSGVVVENSYVASQNFNQWIAEGRREQALGWTIAVDPVAGGVDVRAQAGGQPLAAGSGHVLFQHPLRDTRDVKLPLREISPGHYETVGQVPAGRWHVVVHLSAQGHKSMVRQSVHIIAKRAA